MDTNRLSDEGRLGPLIVSNKLVQFSDSSNKQGLVEDIDFLVGTDSTSYPTAQKTRNINQWYYKVVSWILAAESTWEWDDSNYTDFPIGLTTMVASQEDYTLPMAVSTGTCGGASASTSNPATTLKLLGVSVKDSGGNWRKLKRVDESELRSADLEEVYKTAGMPIYYKELGNSIKLLPAPTAAATTLSCGLKIYFQRTMDEFTASDTTQQPGFAATFHRILSWGGAYDYALAKGLDQAKAFRQEIEQMKSDLQKFYGERNKDEKVRMIPRELYRGSLRL